MAARPAGAAVTFFSVTLALISLWVSVADAQSSATRPVPSNASASQTQPLRDRVRKRIQQLRTRSEGSRLPPADSFTVGPRAVSAAATVRGPVSVAEGSLDVFGRLDGNAYVVDGDIVVHNGGVISGDAVSIGGRVVLCCGPNGRELLTLVAPPCDVVPAAQARVSMTQASSG